MALLSLIAGLMVLALLIFSDSKKVKGSSKGWTLEDILIVALLVFLLVMANGKWGYHV